MKKLAVISLAMMLAACGGSGSSGSDEPAFGSKEALGENLFSDVNLSMNRTQSCATCHDPDKAFTDSATNTDGSTVAVSTGDDGVSLGDRNAPSALYAMFAPAFQSGSRTRFNSQQDDYSGWMGGQFHDGRAAGLAAQAGGPPLNPIEMGMADKASVVDRLLENQDYVESFESLYGSDVFNDTDTAYSAMTNAIAAFENTAEFAPFDSKYDRSLLDSDDPNYYNYGVISKVASGKALFFSQQFTNCATCHQLNRQGSSTETFTGYEFHNIGVPVNTTVRTANGLGDEFIDTGLQGNNDTVGDDATQTGKFKTPTLRNVAVTEPYMHNGVFNELATVLKFYDHFKTGSAFTINPETGVEWAEPEVAENFAEAEMLDGRLFRTTDSDGSGESDEIEAMVCFLMTLTDARYEHLISDEEWETCEAE